MQGAGEAGRSLVRLGRCRRGWETGEARETGKVEGAGELGDRLRGCEVVGIRRRGRPGRLGKEEGTGGPWRVGAMQL